VSGWWWLIWPLAIAGAAAVRIVLNAGDPTEGLPPNQEPWR